MWNVFQERARRREGLEKEKREGEKGERRRDRPSEMESGTLSTIPVLARSSSSVNGNEHVSITNRMI